MHCIRAEVMLRGFDGFKKKNLSGAPAQTRAPTKKTPEATRMTGRRPKESEVLPASK